ncbi:MAG: type I-E CRISPR-associated protein Cas7/Cse4/CasC [Chlorobi bacterium CHB2]|nr:type I-E CRISPR-associated protein Cas7/Cse4/CasC [Chlorobi bacterium CHB2]
MKVELHLLQNFPPANLNRDDTNSPKDCEFGGYRRGRISSQCSKRSIRNSDAFKQELNGQIGIRSQLTAKELTNRLCKAFGKPEAEAQIIARAALSTLISKVDDGGAMSVLFYVGTDELDILANKIHEAWEELLPLITAAIAPNTDNPADGKKKGKKSTTITEATTALAKATESIKNDFLKTRKGHVGTVDIALFGRMLAEQPDLNIDAACQVAHAISTNRVTMDFDYWTAVDDLKEGVGAANIGTFGFNSSCFYRYALIDVDLLEKNLKNHELALSGIRAFIRGTIEAIPTGKQNSFAAQTPPDLIFVVVRETGMPWSLANAFEKPVQPTATQSLMSGSIAALDRQWESLHSMFGSKGSYPFIVVNKKHSPMLKSLASAQVDSLQILIDNVMDTLKSSAKGKP